MRALPSIACLSVLSACGARRIELPDPEGAKSVILLVEGTLDEAYANDLADDAGEIAASVSSDTSDLFVLFYDEPLRAEGLAPGRLPLAASSDLGRPLPAAKRTFRTSVAGGSRAWSRAEAEESRLFRAFRLPLERASDCARRGGCFEAGDSRLCVRPCEPPEDPVPPNLPGPNGGPLLPALEPCPTGWVAREIPDLGGSNVPLVICDPFPNGAIVCGDGEAVLPGQGGCTRIAPECPSGDFPEDLPTDRPVAYVRAGARGGDGTRARPFGRIEDALSQSPIGAAIAVGTGRYEERVSLRNGATLIGACPESVRILATSPGPAIEASLDGGAIERLTIVASSTAVSIADSSRLELTGVVVSSSDGGGIAVGPRGALTARSLLIDAPSGVGVEAAAESSVQISGSKIAGHRAIVAREGAQARAEGSHILGQSRVSGASLEFDASTIEAELKTAVSGTQHAKVSIGRSFVRCRDPGSPCPALVDVDASELRITRTSLEPVKDGARLSNQGVCSMESVAIRFVGAAEVGRGVSALSHDVFAERLVIDGAREAGIWADGESAIFDYDLALSNVVIRNSREEGIVIGDAVSIRTTIVLVEGSGGPAMYFSGPTTQTFVPQHIEDTVLRGNRRGIRVLTSRRIELNRISFNDTIGFALFAGDVFSSPIVFVEQVAIDGVTRDSECDGADDCSGAGVIVNDGNLEMDGFHVRRADRVGAVIGPGASATFRNGRFADLPIAFRAQGQSPTRDLLEAVIFENVGDLCDPCGD